MEPKKKKEDGGVMAQSIPVDHQWYVTTDESLRRWYAWLSQRTSPRHA